jgi:ParG
MAKKSFAQLPQPKQPSPDEIEQFVENGRGRDVEPTPKVPVPPKGAQSKFSVYLPDELHVRYKVLCARRKVSMTGDVRAFIERRVRELEGE